jgi:hypothetical protein
MSKEKTGGHWKNRRRAIIDMHDTYKLQMVVEDQIMSKSSEWITDRLPTKQEAVSGNVICCRWGHINLLQWYKIEAGEPWMPIPKPDMYVKPKRWTVKWGGDDADFFALFDSGKFSYYLPMLFREHADAAQRIADIYNEVMP